MNGLDFLVLAKITFWPTGRWTAVAVAKSLGVHRTQVMVSLRRLKEFNLLSSLSHRVVLANMGNLIHYSIKLLYPPQWIKDPGPGMPTAWSAKPLSGVIASNELVVWPDPDENLDNNATGDIGLKPIHAKIPKACSEDVFLYQFCSLVDAVRAGKTRDRAEAEKCIHEMLRADYSNAE